jgi:hypothetical protein
MMFFGRFHHHAYWTCRTIQLVAFVCVCVVLAVQMIPVTGVAAIDNTQKWIADNQKPVNIILVGTWTAFGILCNFLGHPQILECAKDILATFQREVFGGIGGGELADNHRVTLYRYQTWCLWPGRGYWYWPWGKAAWPNSGWMVPVARAGPDSRASTIFLTKSPTEFEGICGAVHFLQQGVLEMDSTDLPDITTGASDADIATYARKTFVSEIMIRNRIRSNRPCARYFCALRVEVQSKKWGVLMIDSRAAAPPQPQKTQHCFGQLNKVLGHLLKRA